MCIQNWLNTMALVSPLLGSPPPCTQVLAFKDVSVMFCVKVSWGIDVNEYQVSTLMMTLTVVPTEMLACKKGRGREQAADDGVLDSPSSPSSHICAPKRVKGRA